MKNLTKYAALLLCVFVLGCSEGMTTVTGKVTFDDGSPVTRGELVFDDGLKSASAAIKPDGTYSLGALKEGGGVHPGSYKVAVMKNWDSQLDENGDEVKGDEFEVDPKFSNIETSGLTCTVENGKSLQHNVVVERRKK